MVSKVIVALVLEIGLSSFGFLAARADIVDADNRQSGSGTKKAVVGNVYDGRANYVGLRASTVPGSGYSLLTDGINTWLNAPLMPGTIFFNLGNAVTAATITKDVINLNALTNVMSGLNVYNSLNVNSGVATINTKGGNVPHACHRVVASGGGSTGQIRVACAAGEIATGGGGRCASTGMLGNYPDANDAGWIVECVPQSGTNFANSAVAICCAY